MVVNDGDESHGIQSVKNITLQKSKYGRWECDVFPAMFSFSACKISVFFVRVPSAVIQFDLWSLWTLPAHPAFFAVILIAFGNLS